jgi:hypothetical protein
MDEKIFWSCSKFLRVSNRIKIRFKSFSTPIDLDVRPCHRPLHERQCSIRQGSMRFYIAGWCGSMRLEPGQYGYIYGIKILAKILNMTKTIFSAASCSQNPSGIDRGYDAGLYVWNRVDTVLISYGPSSKSGSVWLHSRNADLIVNCFDPCWPAFNSWFTRTDACCPAAANIKEKLGKSCWPVSNCSVPYLPFSYSGDQLLNQYTKTVYSRFYPECMQITIHSETIPANFHPHQIRFVTRLCVTVA